MENRLRSLEITVDSIKSDMPLKSDIAAIGQKVDGIEKLAEEVAKNNGLVTQILIQNAKNEEKQANQDKHNELVDSTLDAYGKDIQKQKEIEAANKPIRELGKCRAKPTSAFFT